MVISVSASGGTLVRSALRASAELATLLAGLGLLAWALAADQRWFDAHFLPAFFISRDAYVRGEWMGRIAAALLGIFLALIVRPRVGRFVARRPALVLGTCAASMLALATSELILRQLHVHAAPEEPFGQEPRRRLDPRLGWTFVPSRSARHLEGHREIDYAFDQKGHRVRNLDEPVDPARPAILFAGESMMVGEGLTWDESIPAQVGSLLGIQSANLAVSAYATDQVYLRLESELPQYREPKAVVTVFAPALFDRNMDDDRPHLGPGLVWRPPTERWRLLEILRLVVRYRKEDTIERGIAMTRDVLRATCELARARGAIPLIVVPQFLPESDKERSLRHRLFDESGLPIERVELDGGWRIPGDGHPDARAARAIASAVAARLHDVKP